MNPERVSSSKSHENSEKGVIMRKICRRSLAVILSLMFLLSSCAKPEYSVYHFETEESGKTAQESEKEPDVCTFY